MLYRLKTPIPSREEPENASTPLKYRTPHIRCPLLIRCPCLTLDSRNSLGSLFYIFSKEKGCRSFGDLSHAKQFSLPPHRRGCDWSAQPLPGHSPPETLHPPESQNNRAATRHDGPIGDPAACIASPRLLRAPASHSSKIRW